MEIFESCLGGSDSQYLDFSLNMCRLLPTTECHDMNCKFRLLPTTECHDMNCKFRLLPTTECHDMNCKFNCNEKTTSAFTIM